MYNGPAIVDKNTIRQLADTAIYAAAGDCSGHQAVTVSNHQTAALFHVK